MKRILFLVAIVALVLSSQAYAWTQYEAINEVSSTFAMRPVGAKCYAREEPDSPWGYGAWGYVNTPLRTQGFSHLDERLCAGALAVNDETLPTWQRALGVLVVVHEAYHLRRWSAAGSEAKVECKTIRHWKVAARMFGATEETVEDLWPSALASHYRLTTYQDFMGEQPYYDPTCKVPPLMDLGEEQ